MCEPHICSRCNTEPPSDGSHGLHCRHSAGRQSRHTHLNGIVQRTLATVHLPSVLSHLVSCALTKSGQTHDPGSLDSGVFTCVGCDRGRPSCAILPGGVVQSQCNHSLYTRQPNSSALSTRTLYVEGTSLSLSHLRPSANQVCQLCILCGN